MRNIVETYLNHASFIIFQSVYFLIFLFLSPDRYIAPCDGIYQFSAHLTRESSSNGVDLDIYVDGSRVGAHSDLYQTTDFRSTTLLQELQAGQTVYVSTSYGADGSPTFQRTYFSGYMISSI